MASQNYGEVQYNMNMSKINKLIKTLDFETAYCELCKKNYSFTFDNLLTHFPKIDVLKMYAFLLYAITQHEDEEKYITICNYLYFMEPSMWGANSLIKWHLIQALKIPTHSTKIEEWILGVYDGNPDSPFDEEEIALIRQTLIQKRKSGDGSVIEKNKML